MKLGRNEVVQRHDDMSMRLKRQDRISSAVGWKSCLESPTSEGYPFEIREIMSF